MLKYDIETLASAWKGHRKFANRLVEILQPSIIVDLGVDYGYSLFSLAEPNIGHVYGIDTFEGDIHSGHHADAYDVVCRVLEQNKYNNITLIKGFFDEVASTWDKKIDILHIDGLHTYEAVKNDINKWTPFLSEKGVLLMHDTTTFEGVSQAFNEIEWPKFNFNHSAGLGVCFKSQELYDVICDVLI